jgi:2-polyprenyl-3-methyl-5-hydroxy-6-metoxy-1,4-benzoquinol methylase
MATFTTEIASDKLVSDNPIHQRLLKAYILAKDHVKGKLLEVGCGEGRGVEILSPLSESYVALDKITDVIEKLSHQYPNVAFKQAVVPPFEGVAGDSFDVVVSFQVIEHIQNDKKFLEEIHRVLKPGGKAIISTPNIKMTLTRNPWHIREYTSRQLIDLCSSIFSRVEAKGVAGNDKVMEYYEENKKSVRKITRFDIFNLQYRLPAGLLRIPYDIMNRFNRMLLKNKNSQLVSGITHEDYLLSDDPENSLDLYYILYK